jgi:hypothetical protein
MKRFLILFAAFAFLFLSCSQNSKEKTSIQTPDNLIPTEKMIDILTDVHIAEALLTQHQMHGKNTTYYTALYNTTILKKYKITRKSFMESIRYYAYNTVELEKIYTEVVTNLVKKQTAVNIK